MELCYHVAEFREAPTREVSHYLRQVVPYSMFLAWGTGRQHVKMGVITADEEVLRV